MRFLCLQSARWLGFPGGTDNYNFDIPCGSGGRLKMFALGRFRCSYATGCVVFQFIAFIFVFHPYRPRATVTSY